MKSREQTPDWVKGVAIVLMVYGHITHVGTLALSQQRLVEVIYTFHMPLFLMISGYFFRVDGLEPRAACQRLCQRLVLPYVVFLSLYLVGLSLIHRLGVHTANLPPESMLDFARIVVLSPRGAYWFIHSLIVIQLCLIAARAVTMHGGRRDSLFWPVAGAMLVLVWQMNLCGPRTVVFFVVGLVWQQLKFPLPSSIAVGALVTGLLGWLGTSEIFVFSVSQVVWCLGILSLLAGAGRAAENTRLVSLFAWLGRNSLPVLVLHALFIVAMKPVSSLILRGEATGVLNSFATLTVTVVLCLVVAELLDFLGMSRLLFGVREVYSRRSP